MSVILHFIFLGVIALALVFFAVLWVIEMLDKVSTLEEYAPGLVHFARHKKWHPVVLLISIIFLAVDTVELYIKEVPEVPLPPVVKIEAPRSPSLNVVRVNPPIEKQCWVRNYGAPALPAPPPWGMATIFCNTTINPPYSIELLYDQDNITVGPFTFPVGSEFAKSTEFNQGARKVLAMFELHTIIPNEPFSIMAKGANEAFPLVKKATIRAKGLTIDFKP